MQVTPMSSTSQATQAYLSKVEKHIARTHESVLKIFERRILHRELSAIKLLVDVPSFCKDIEDNLNVSAKAKPRAKPRAKRATFAPALQSISEESPPPAPAKQPDHFAKFVKVPLVQNGKTPACRWRDPANQTKEALDPSYRNTGIPTGSLNNLLVLDLDVKDDGVKKFPDYIADHGNPNTLTVQTPSGGFHYYFNLRTPAPTTSC